MSDTPPNPAQKGLQQEVSYTSPEGHNYSEVHGDPNKNITVESFAEKEGALQPNLEGTTPDPFEPKLTEKEAQRRGVTVEGEPLDKGEATPPEPLTTTRGSQSDPNKPQEDPDKAQQQEGAQKQQSASPANKQANKPADK